MYKGIEEKCTPFLSLDDDGKFTCMLSAGVGVAELAAKFTYINLP